MLLWECLRRPLRLSWLCASRRQASTSHGTWPQSHAPHNAARSRHKRITHSRLPWRSCEVRDATAHGMVHRMPRQHMGRTHWHSFWLTLWPRQLRLFASSLEQELYEALRPIVLFGRSSATWRRWATAAHNTLRTKKSRCFMCSGSSRFSCLRVAPHTAWYSRTPGLVG
jgi:hypothetical protein